MNTAGYVSCTLKGKTDTLIKGITNKWLIGIRESNPAILDMFKDTLKHEKKVTSLINNIAAIANDDKDFASINRMVWFIDEQVEEEESAREMVQSFEAVADNKYGMYMLDKELATRTYNVPSPLASSAE